MSRLGLIFSTLIDSNNKGQRQQHACRQETNEITGWGGAFINSKKTSDSPITGLAD
jgi:hypothetical protein